MHARQKLLIVGFVHFVPVLSAHGAPSLGVECTWSPTGVYVVVNGFTADRNIGVGVDRPEGPGPPFAGDLGMGVVRTDEKGHASIELQPKEGFQYQENDRVVAFWPNDPYTCGRMKIVEGQGVICQTHPCEDGVAGGGACACESCENPFAIGIPTISEWGIVVLALSIAVMGVVVLRARGARIC